MSQLDIRYLDNPGLAGCTKEPTTRLDQDMMELMARILILKDIASYS